MTVTIITGDARERLKSLPDKSVHCCVTSPPYFGLRDYKNANQIGLEATPDAFVKEMVLLFASVRHLLCDDGTLWLNLGDSYAGSWGAQSRGGAPSEKSTLQGNGHIGGGPKIKSLSKVSIEAHPKTTMTGSLSRTPGLKPKDLIGIPWRVAFALQADGWWLRDAIVWAKPNGMPGSQDDRCTSSYEMIFHLSKSAQYWSDFDAIKTPPRESSLIRTAQDTQAQAGSHRANGGKKTNGSMRAVGVLAELKERKSDKQRGHGRKHAGFNDRWDAMEKSEQQARPAMMRNVWFVSPMGYNGAHFAVMPEEIARRCILAGCPEGGTVLDPFGGAGTTGLVADRLQRNGILIELNPEYAEMARRRIDGDSPLFARAAE
jgi:DNA modification methylase